MLVNPITSPADSWARSCRQNPSIAAPTSSFHIASRTLLHHGQIKECLYRLACDRILLTKLQNGSLGNTVVLHLILLQEMVLMCTHNYIWHIYIYMIIYVLGASHRLGSWWCRDIHQDLMLQRVAESYEAARVFFRSLIVRDSHIDSTQDSYGYGSIPINTIFMVGWTSLNPSYFDVNYRGTRFWPIAIYVYWRRIKEKMPGTCVWVHSPSPTDCPPFGSNMNSSRRLSPWDPMETPMFAAYTVLFHHFCQLNHCYSICLPVKLRHVSPFLVVKLVKP